MSVTRRNFLLNAGWAAVAGAAFPATGISANSMTSAFKPDDWRSVRAQFNLSPDVCASGRFLYCVASAASARSHRAIP
jgi:hypothetical protein